MIDQNLKNIQRIFNSMIYFKHLESIEMHYNINNYTIIYISGLPRQQVYFKCSFYIDNFSYRFKVRSYCIPRKDIQFINKNTSNIVDSFKFLKNLSKEKLYQKGLNSILYKSIKYL